MNGYGAGLVGASLRGIVAVPFAAVDPIGFLDTSAVIRAVAAFLLVTLVGGVLVHRHEPFVERSIDATLNRPVASIGYGVAAHLVIGFAGFYLTARLGGVTISGLNPGSIGILVFVLLLLLSGAIGFTVIGGTLVDVWSGGRRWSGPLTGGAIAAGVAVINPVFGIYAWLVLVSVGIGGPVRRWLNASVVDI